MKALELVFDHGGVRLMVGRQGQTWCVCLGGLRGPAVIYIGRSLSREYAVEQARSTLQACADRLAEAR